MGRIGKTFALTLMIIVALSCLSLLTVKPASAQSNTIPSVSILYPSSSTVFNVSIEGVYFNVLYQTNDTLSWVGFSIEGQQLGGNVTCTGNDTDYTEFINDDYQFDFGHPTLTLYANDTEGNWAIPQTVTYTVYFYADTVPNPNVTPTVPELSWLVILPLLLSMLSVAVLIRHRKTGNLNQ